MPEALLELPWGKEKLSLHLPGQWNLPGVMEPSSSLTPVKPGEEVEKSLAAPIGAPRLSEMIQPGMKIALVIDDESRPTPVAMLILYDE
jgi:lactate racemase